MFYLVSWEKEMTDEKLDKKCNIRQNAKQSIIAL